MTERPIPFSAPMVRALLAGTKTQTRRVVKLPHQNPLGHWEVLPWGGPNGGRTREGQTVPRQTLIGHSRTGDIVGCAYGQPGDRLWVREAWRAPTSCDHLPPRSIGDSEALRFIADETVGADPGFGKCRPGMFMPRWASRITLEITGVRVERLQEITRGDAMVEGCPFQNLSEGPDPRDWYRDLWEQINGPDTWASNPWVWVLDFRRLAEAPCG